MSAGRDVFKRPRDFDDRALGVSLRPYEWEVLLALDGRTPFVQLLRRMGLDELDADEVADELTGKGLMDQCVVTYGEFMRERETTAARSADVQPAAPTATNGAAAALAAATLPSPAVEPKLRATIKPQPPRLSFSVKPTSAPMMPRVAVGISGYKLKPLLDFIIDQAGGKNLPKIAAQLAVYRVFRRVPRELVLADNIHSLKIGDPTIEVHNKELYDAIVRAIETTFGVKYESNAANTAAG
ncbi:MAG: hypothetical protein JO219_06170 [Candidatus Eremiobacteraeota bacterium]|nr:hypothetical protein [Candidatus Eremiobacteraeota bacterium]MBV8364887.1 hypothetical protein [Candidatus Eremiobacteraeota bacterium]